MYLGYSRPRRRRGREIPVDNPYGSSVTTSLNSYIGAGDSTPPKGAAGVAWWKQALSVGGDIVVGLLPKIKEWLGTADKASADDLLTWLQTNSSLTSQQYKELEQSAQTQTWVLIGVLAAAVAGGLYFMNKRGSSVPAVKIPVKA
jgi:hypothetical protein